MDGSPIIAGLTGLCRAVLALNVVALAIHFAVRASRTPSALDGSARLAVDLATPAAVAQTLPGGIRHGVTLS